MRVQLSKNLPVRADRLWAELQTPRLFLHVSRPVMRFTPVGRTALPELWADGRYRVWMWLFGVLPMGRQWIDISRPVAHDVEGHRYFQLRDRGTGDLIRAWDHIITVEELPSGETRYTDRIDVRAGPLTPFVWAFASLLFCHRQRRLRRLVQSGFLYP